MFRLVLNRGRIQKLIGRGRQRFYAKRLGVTEETLSRRLYGRGVIRLSDVDELGRLLGVRPLTLLEEVEDG